jgi:hypothetical protein
VAGHAEHGSVLILDDIADNGRLRESLLDPTS